MTGETNMAKAASEAGPHFLTITLKNFKNQWDMLPKRNTFVFAPKLFVSPDGPASYKRGLTSRTPPPLPTLSPHHFPQT